jgi:hypothetical protein
MRGRAAGIRWHLDQNGNAVTGTYTPQNATINGAVDDKGRLNFAWIEHGDRGGTTGAGRGYLILMTPDEWQGRWWTGNSPVDPTPTAPNTWHGTRTPPAATTLPKIRLPLPKLQLNVKP